MSEGEVALACMGAFVDGLASSGLEHACVSPGSRSTPLALALSRHPRVTVHVHLDERSSAFFALGLAKATGRPVAVACTSGTAAANLFPAVVEASMSCTPLLLLTADRPPELHGVGANQTIDQQDLFGRYVKRFVDAGVPGDHPDAQYWAGMALNTVGTALAHPPGPAHVNLPFREPLVPSADATKHGGVTTVSGEMVFVGPRPQHADIDDLLAEISDAEQGVVIAGTLRFEASLVVELARDLGWPLIAEPTSGLRIPGSLSAGEFLLANEAFCGSHVPELVLQVGAAPTSRAGLAFVAAAKRLLIVDPDRLVADPGRRASRTMEADPGMLARAVGGRIPRRGETSWLREWLDADALARRAVDDLID